MKHTDPASKPRRPPAVPLAGLMMAAACTSATEAPSSAQPCSPADAHATIPAPGVRIPNLAAGCSEQVTVWVDLDLPELASLPTQETTLREAHRIRIVAQQDDVMARLRGLGATEMARVQIVRNALGVRLPRGNLEAARALPGVRAVRPARNVGLHPLAHGD